MPTPTLRGSEKLKGIHSMNQEVKSILLKCLGLYNALVFFVYWHKSASKVLFCALSSIELIVLVVLFKLTNPKIEKEEKTQKIVHVASINAPGMISFCWDVLFWAIVGKFLVVFNWKWAFVYFGIPVAFFFEILYKPYKKLKLS